MNVLKRIPPRARMVLWLFAMFMVTFAGSCDGKLGANSPPPPDQPFPVSNEPPDEPGNLIAFNSDTGSGGADHDVYVVSATGGTPTLITTNTLLDYGPTWSPDGAFLAFARDDGTNVDLVVANRSTGSEQNITTGVAGIDQEPDWNPIP